MNKRATLFILLPAFNEKENLKKMFIKYNFFFKKNLRSFNIKVIVIDDGSNDCTGKYISNIKNNFVFKIIYSKNKKNLGLGLTIKKGFIILKNLAKNNDFLVTMDADNSHQISHLLSMFKKLKSNDLIIASRFLKGSRIKGLSTSRKLLSFVGSYLFKILFPIRNVKDYTCGYRLYKYSFLKPYLKNINKFIDQKNFTVSVDFLLKMRANKDLKIEEIPINLRYDLKTGVSKMKVLMSIFETIKLILIRI